MAKLAGPIVLTQLGWVAMLTTDAAMIGRLGKVPLAGATLARALRRSAADARDRRHETLSQVLASSYWDALSRNNFV